MLFAPTTLPGCRQASRTSLTASAGDNRRVDVRLVDRDWRQELVSCYERESHGLRIVCPFIKQEALWGVVGDHLHSDVRVITRFDLKGFAAGVSDIDALVDVLEAGGEVRGVRGLHSKTFIFGAEVAVVTSANMTRRGLDHNVEFGCVSDLAAFVAACRAYFDELWTKCGPSVSQDQLGEWQEVVDAFLATGARAGTRALLPDHGADAGQAPAAGIPLPDEIPDASGTVVPAWLDEATQGHVKIFGEADSRAQWTMDVLQEIDESGSHWACTYPRGRGRPRNVHSGDAMYIARMVEGPNDYLIYGRAAALEHVDARDVATAAEIEDRPWKEQWPFYIRIHDAEFVAGTLSNGVPLSHLIEELGSNAFATTQEHAQMGTGNTNPRRALMQQAAVRLSDDGFAWVTERFDQALQRNGRVPADDLAELDWPASFGPPAS